MDSLAAALLETRQELERSRIAEGYFTTILNSQTTIFSVIVAVLVAVSWIFSFYRTKDLIVEQMRPVHARVAQIQAELSEASEKRIDSEMQEVRNEIANLHAALSRAFASMFEKRPGVSFIWWLRAASEYTEDQREMISSALDSAHSAVLQLVYKHDLSTQMAEIEQRLSGIDLNKHRVAVDAIRKELERVYRNEYKSGS